jgi:hypothetical protein
MSFKTVLTGKKSRRYVGSKKRSTVPFLGVVGSGHNAEIILGLHLLSKKAWMESDISFQGRSLQAWRALRLLEKLKRVSRNSLNNCLAVMEHPNAEVDGTYLRYFRQRFTCDKEFLRIRTEIVNTKPDEKQFYTLLEYLYDRSMPICREELHDAVSAGLIEKNALLNKILSGATPCTNTKTDAKLNIFSRICLLFKYTPK